MALVGARRSWLAVVAVLGLVGSLLAVGVVPAAAADGTADNEAVYSACVGPALESLGLTDIEGSFAEDAVNCLGHYGITKGRTATTYDPGAPVLRWQMALFLSRAAGPAGVQLMAETADDFTDLEGVSDEIRSAINQMAALEIMPGTGSGRFSPDTAVSRKTMAEMLDAFLGEARLGKGALGGGSEDELSEVTPDDTVFTDIGNVTRGQYSAIQRMFEVGVTRGTTDSQFSPEGLVTRGQMAAFITRMLAHTVARPAGLTIQASVSSVAGTATDPGDLDLVVSLRDSAHMAMPDALVDLFTSTNPGDAFDSDGNCSNDEVQSIGGGAGTCEIASSDVPTDSDGDRELVGAQFGASATVWAWTGDAGAKFDAENTVSASLEITVTKPATKLQITDNMAANAIAAKFGDRVTFTIQVTDADGNAVATKDESVTVFAGTTVDSAATDAAPATGSSTVAHKTDDSGRIELSYRQTDPRTSGSNNGGDKAWLNLDIEYNGGLELVDKTTLKMAEAGAGGTAEGNAAVLWLDTPAEAKTLTLAQAVSFHEASGAGSGAANTVTATMVDQYGDPVSRQRVEFTSDDANGIGAKPATAGAPAALMGVAGAGMRTLTGEAALTRTTNRRGVATLSYNRDSADSGIETIQAKVGTVNADRIYHYWANELDDNANAEGRLLATDTDNNQMVIFGGGAVSLIKYDSNDQFTGTDGAATLSAFETDLKDNAKRAKATGYRNASKNVSEIEGLGDRWSKALDTTKAGTNYAVDHGVFVVGDPSAMCDHDTDTDTDMVACGAVHVYEAGSDNAYGDPVTLKSPNEDDGDDDDGGRFGADVDIGIGGTHIVVGAPGEGTGKVYVLTKGSDGWASSAELSSGTANVANLGMAVAISDNAADADDQEHYAVAVADAGIGVARWIHDTGSGMDITQVPWANDSTPDQETGVIAGVGGANTLAVANDGTAFVGAPDAMGEPASGTGKAKVGKLYAVDAAVTAANSIAVKSDAGNRMLGASVSVAGDGSAVAAGAPGDNAVYVITSSDSWAAPVPDADDPADTMLSASKLSDGSAAGDVGLSVAISSDGATVAISDGDVAAGERGEVFTFAKGSAWAAQTSGTNLGGGPSPNTMFTYMVAFDGNDLHAAAHIGGTFMDIYEVSTT